MTYIAITEATNKILYRSRIKLASIDPNRLIDQNQHPTADINIPTHSTIDTSRNYNSDSDSDAPVPPTDAVHPSDTIAETQQPETPTNASRMATIDVEDLIGKTYLTQPSQDGTRARLKIVEQLDNQERTLNSAPAMIRFRATNNDNTVEEIIAYNQVIDRLESSDGDNDEWKFRAIVDHEGPLNQNDKRYKGSAWNVKVDWENGESTWEPLSIIARSDPVTCAIYGKDHNLLNQPGWVRFKNLANRQKKLIRMVNQAKLQSFRQRQIYKFGVHIPRDHKQAMELDRENGKNL